MNWEEIKEKYPRSYNLIYQQAREYANVLYESPIRWLYDFFDTQGIYIGVEVWHTKLHKHFSCVITDKFSSHPIYSQTDIVSRTEAEEQAFITAFEILESKL